MAMKQQSSLEFMITYSWAFIILSLFVISVVVLSGARSPASYLGSSCNIQPLLPCAESLLSYNSISPLQYYVLFTNQLGTPIYLSTNSLNVSTSNLGGSSSAYALGNCTPSIAAEGSSVLCSARISAASKPSVGTQVIFTFSLNYKICPGGTIASCQPGLYKSSGYSLQTVAPSSVRLNYVTFNTIPATGTVVLNGVSYYNGVSTYLPSGNYVMFSPQTQGTRFLSWSVNSLSTSLSSYTQQNTTLVLSSNAIITARSS